MKQAKKAQKDLDEDDKAFLEKKRAGTNLKMRKPQRNITLTTAIQTRRLARSLPLRLEARALSTPVARASRRAERNRDLAWF